ncbi:MAG TPA: hypothetical protein VG122_17750 [Gemmata sp.]|jgi:hypothetical protein|nr:hypothetical protein [Gemmata sp.]
MRVLYFIAAFVAMGTLAAFVARTLFAPTGLATGQPADPKEFLSGPQVGSKIPGPFEPLNINGKDAGEEACLYCRYGNAPVVMIFATKPTEGLDALVRHVEKAAVEAGRSGGVGACVVITESNEDTKTALSKLADKENLKQVVLGMIEPRFLKKYQLHSAAEVTVLLYSKLVVRVNHAYKPGELTEKVASDLGKEAATFLAEK